MVIRRGNVPTISELFLYVYVLYVLIKQIELNCVDV